ncbi:MAG: phosphomannomutase/phosphoglucomutase [Candidatus Nanohaloarchaea archaeon]
MASFFHAYDLRGRYPDEIGEKEAERVGKAFGTWTSGEAVLVGRDGRTHGEKVSRAFVRGLKSAGVDVIYAGMVPTPVVYQAMIARDIDAAAVVTASHNPQEYTGFKFCKSGALAVSREGGMEEVERIYEEEDFDTGEGDVEQVDLEKDYVEFVSEAIELERPLEVVVNYGNGVTAAIGKEMLEEIGCSVRGVNDEVDGNFPNHLPAPGEEEAQQQLIEAMDGEDLGIIFDGDGDRAGFVLPGYGYVPEDEVLAVFAEECLSLEKGKVVHDLRASKLVKERVREAGGEPVESRVGHTFISEMIHDDPEVVFAGELSGHYYFPCLGAPYDDGLLAAALMCQVVSERDLAEELESFPYYPVSPELRIDCPENAKQEVVERVVERYSGHDTSTIDGVKVEFPEGWALVRPSNTEPKMSVRCEADTEEALDRILEEVESSVREFIREAG